MKLSGIEMLYTWPAAGMGGTTRKLSGPLTYTYCM